MASVIERLKENLGYDPNSGRFWWKKTGKGRRPGDIGTLTVTKDGYRYIRIGFEGRSYMASHLAFALMKNRWPDPLKRMDHKDRDGTNNKWVNLREVTATENNLNRRQMPCRSGHTFISLCNSGKFRVRINGVSRGTFETLDEALEERNRWQP